MPNPLKLTHNDLTLTRRTLSFQRWPVALNGLKVVQVSDLHIYEYSDPDFYSRVTDMVTACEPDVLVMTGDAIHIGDQHVKQAEKFLSGLPAQYGRFAILGNHDYDDGHLGEAMKQCITQAGFTLLLNNSQRVACEGFKSLTDCGADFKTDSETSLEKAGNNVQNRHKQFYIAGLEDLWYGKPNIERALTQCPEEAFVLMLAHNPLLFDPVALAYPGRVDWMLSGHTHAGHVYIPVLGPIYQKIFRMKYRYGVFQKNATTLCVTSGVGSAAFALKKKKRGFPRFRWNTTPEVAVYTLVSAQTY
ncbi:MAG: metallophosphoesterase [Cyanobacteria bacterium P01_H01_bin.74]